MPRWLRMSALPLVALALVAAACGDDDGSGDGGEPTDGAAAECTSDLTVGVALDVGGLGDNGFNDLSEIGLNQAIADGIVCEENTEFIEANSEGTNLDENTQSLAEAGYDVVIGTGFAFSPGINAIAPDYPETSFAHHRRVRDVRHRLWPRQRCRCDPQRHRPDVPGGAGVVPRRAWPRA